MNAAGALAGWLRQGLLVACLLLTAACGGDPADPPVVETGQPAIWEIAASDGEVEGWLFGTIHALPDGTRWQSAPVRSAIENADILAVEIAALDDGQAIAEMFARLSHTPGQPALRARIPAAQHTELDRLIARTPYGEGDFAAIESWGAALILAQAAQSASSSANGVDKTLIRAFRPDRPVREIEGARRQLGVFDTLPEAEQRDLLAITIAEAARPEDERARTVRKWLSGDVEGMLDPAGETLLADPELREALVEGRNRAWVPAIIALLEQDPRPLIAVGAGHMGGPEGLPVLLRAQGYTVTRL